MSKTTVYVKTVAKDRGEKYNVVAIAKGIIPKRSERQ